MKCQYCGKELEGRIYESRVTCGGSKCTQNRTQHLNKMKTVVYRNYLAKKSKDESFSE